MFDIYKEIRVITQINIKTYHSNYACIQKSGKANTQCHCRHQLCRSLRVAHHIARDIITRKQSVESTGKEVWIL